MRYVPKMRLRALAVLSTVFLGNAVLRAAVPANFTDELVTAVGSPTAIAFTPDGRMLITTQGGTLRVFASGSLLPTPAMTIPAAQICTSSERGLLGVAVDPAFGVAGNRFIYVFYTFETPSSNCVNRVSRFTLPDSNIIDLASQLVLIDNMPSPNGNHNAGDVGFGKDGFLYVTIGDGGCDWAGNSGCAGLNDAARDRHVLTGKLLRITSTGGIPASNPFQGPNTARCNTGPTTVPNTCQEIYATGLRNPFRFAFDPNAAGTRLFINDVGQGLWEEVDEAQSGADYGWNLCEGDHPNNSTATDCGGAEPPGYVEPVFDYRHGLQVPGTTSSTTCNSITGGAFVPNGIWPAAYDGTYLLSDFVCGWIFRITNTGPSWAAADFATSLGGSSATHLEFGPYLSTQALYYATFASGGQIRRVRYAVAGNNVPTAVGNAAPLSGAAPLLVTFDATGSTDLDAGDTLTYFWNFGDGSAEVSTTSLTTNHSYGANGAYTARLRARDSQFAFSAAVDLAIQVGNTPPVPSISSPADGAVFSVGQIITLTGAASDAEDGTVASGGLSWTVLRHHDVHTHPYFSGTGNNLMFTAPAPEDLDATNNSFLEVHLTATDSGGLSAATQRDMQPLKITLTLNTSPAGMNVELNGGPRAHGSTLTSWAGWGLQVNAEPQMNGGTFRQWSAWSDGGLRAHTYATPATNSTLTATFVAWPPAGTGAFHTLTPCRVVDTRNAVGPFGGPALATGATREFLLAGQCGVPATALGVAANVTTIDATSSGLLELHPSGQVDPLDTGLPIRAGVTRATFGAFGLANGQLDVTPVLGVGGSVHLLIDVSGYFD
jgi:glucose/arabinose dehydrogenase